MGAEVQVTCDYLVVPDEKVKCGAKAPVKFELVNGVRVYSMLACRPHVDSIESELLDIGFSVAIKTDDKIRRGYITESGRPFSAQEARDWLKAKGEEVPAAGRLSSELLEKFRIAN